MVNVIANATGNPSQIDYDIPMYTAALDAAQASELASEIVEHGRGASIYHALATQNMIPIKDFASWVCVEKKCSRVSW